MASQDGFELASVRLQRIQGGSVRGILILTVATAFTHVALGREFRDSLRDQREAALSEWKDFPREPTPKPWEGRSKFFLGNELPRRIRSLVAQPRGRVRAWRSLKDKRRAWGIT